MSKLVYTSNTPFDMQDWALRNNFASVSAGRNCAVAVLKDGTVLKRICKDKDNASCVDENPLENRERTNWRARRMPNYHTKLTLTAENGWDSIRKVSVSRIVGGVVVGLRTDGRCIIHIDPERSTDYGLAMIANSRVANWRDIIEVAVSDAIFGLDRSGKVHHFAFCGPDDYDSVNDWDNVSHIVTGSQNSVFGITHDGRALCAGSNCDEKLRATLSLEREVKDICTTGSECEKVLLLHNDGIVSTARGTLLLENSFAYTFVKLYGHFYHTVFGQTDDLTIIPLLSDFDSSDCERMANWRGIRSFSMGQKGYSRPFAIAVVE